MKKIRKTIAAFTALTMAMSVNVISANASGSYLRGDVDGNGTVDLIDAITLVQFLNGSVGADGATAERMDVHRDYVINEYDRITLSSILLGDTPMGYTHSLNTTALPAQENRVYLKYNANNVYQGYYTLNTVSNVSQTSSRCIVGGSDDRIPENGFEGVVNIQNFLGENVGTGFVVDSHTILTAAHVLVANNGVHDHSFVIFDDYNTETNITITPTMYHIPQNFTNSDEAVSQLYDYAIVTVQEDLSDYINFNLGVMRDDISTDQYVYVTGFGGEAKNENDQDYINSNLINVKSTGSGHIVSRSEVSNLQITHTVDTVGGDSGSPLYIYNPDGTKTVIGIHIRRPDNGYEYNKATRITTDILNFIFNNSNL